MILTRAVRWSTLACPSANMIFEPEAEAQMRGLVVEDLLAEIKAIVAWDHDYASRKTHDEVDRAAWEARQKRLIEIQREFIRMETDFGGQRGLEIRLRPNHANRSRVSEESGSYMDVGVGL